MRYLLGGYYGMRNVGDDVLLYVFPAERPARAFTSAVTRVARPSTVGF